MECTKRRNLNRGYMKLEVWQRAIDLFGLACKISTPVADLKLKSQFRDSFQSVSANVAEYLQFLYTSKGSLGEALTRAIGFQSQVFLNRFRSSNLMRCINEVENKLSQLIRSIETKREQGDWSDTLPPSSEPT